MQSNDFLSVDEILADVLLEVNDEEIRSGLKKGWYTSKIQQALEELSFDTFFDEVTLDLPFDKVKLSLEMPRNAFNVREIYLFNGDCCSPDSSVLVHYKRLYNNRGKGIGHTAKLKESGQNTLDPFFATRTHFVNRGAGRNAHYANIVNGLIMLSSNAAGFDKIRLVFNGMSGAIGDEPVIPRFFRQAVMGFVVEAFWRFMKPRDKSARLFWADADRKLNDPRQGTWRQAKMRITSMDQWKKQSLKEYLGRLDA